MNTHSLPVVDEALCTACGDCVEVCPKDLFTLEPVSHNLWVACRNLEHGDAILEDCAVACTACGRCAMDAPAAIRMQDNLPVIDYRAVQQRDAIQRCPTGAIVWIDRDGSVSRGDAARPVVRHTPLGTAAT